MIRKTGPGALTPVEAPELVSGKIRQLAGTYLRVKEGA
jgi:hypothetical protein